MSRSLDSSLLAEVTADRLQPVYLFDFIFDSGSLYFFTGLGTLSFNGNAYLGSGNLLSFEHIQESGEIEAKNTRITLSGIPESLIAIALAEHSSGRPCRMYFGTLNDNGAIVGTPYQFIDGLMDGMDISEDPRAGTSTIDLKVENSIYDLTKNRIRYYTTEDQVKEFPSDLGFEFLPRIQDRKVVWGGSGNG